MLNPIKRVWVPKNPPAAPVPPAPQVRTESTQVVSAPEPSPSKRGILFEELPEPEVSEKFSDSVWAEFDSILPQKVPSK